MVYDFNTFEAFLIRICEGFVPPQSRVYFVGELISGAAIQNLQTSDFQLD